MSSIPPLLGAAAGKRHVWKFIRVGGLDQVALTTAADLLALEQLDQKLWVALSCPVKGLELDEKTLALIDADHDGRIRVPELIDAVKWACARLKDPAVLLRGADPLPLTDINDATEDGKVILAGAKQILASLGQANATAIPVSATDDVSKIFAASALNGDGVIPLEATTDADAQALIKDILACLGGVPDRMGAIGITAEKTEAFYTELGSYVAWLDKSAASDVAVLGTATDPAVTAIRAVRPKVDDYFARCRLAAFDPRAITALNRQESEYLAIAAKDLKITAEEVAGFPLARIEAGRALPLFQNVNPAWAVALAALHSAAVTPILGGAKVTLTEEEWATLTAKFSAYEAWLGSKPGSAVEKLGLDRARELLAGRGRDTLNQLLAQDKALEPEFNAISAVDRLVRYHRDLRALLNNFVNFSDFYSPSRLAVFQAGTLYLDSRSAELCLRVEGPNPLAAMSKAYIVYCACTRANSPAMTIAACVTQGDSDYLFVGRHGVFYDRAGHDWDAVITSIVDHPISIHQAFWSPYKKFIRFIEEQVAKRAAAADADAVGKLAAAAETTANADKVKPEPKKFDLALVTGISVAIGSIMGALAVAFSKFVEIPLWKVPLIVAGLMLLISLPSMVIAWLKLRQRTIGPILDANGWAINGRVKINIPFGTALTERAVLPAGAQRSLKDPYAEKKHGRRTTLVVVVVLLVLLAVAKVFGCWPFSTGLVHADDSPAEVEAMQ